MSHSWINWLSEEEPAHQSVWWPDRACIGWRASAVASTTCPSCLSPQSSTCTHCDVCRVARPGCSPSCWAAADGSGLASGCCSRSSTRLCGTPAPALLPLCCNPQAKALVCKPVSACKQVLVCKLVSACKQAWAWCSLICAWTEWASWPHAMASRHTCASLAAPLQPPCKRAAVVSNGRQVPGSDRPILCGRHWPAPVETLTGQQQRRQACANGKWWLDHSTSVGTQYPNCTLLW